MNSASMVSDGFLTSSKDDGLLARLTFYINEKYLGVIFVNRYDGGAIRGQ
jgi:hypothetical protein